MPSIDATDVVRMRDQLFIEGPDARHRSTRFWMLLALAAVIATAGVVADSTATVIGAMIVAPLMTPILGIVVGISLGDRPNIGRSIVLVLAGAAAVVAIGYAIGLLVQVPVLETTNSQVAARVSPRLIDFVAALATGAVGAFALVRSDISDTLPGVAIAISLVPPLAVVGLTLESGAPDQAGGALLLFATNVAAILTTGLIVTAAYRVPRFAVRTGSRDQRNAALVVGALVVVVLIPLVASTTFVARTTLTEQEVRRGAEAWAERNDWEVVQVTTQHGVVLVRVVGSGAQPDPAVLRARLDDEGLADVSVRLELVPETTVDLSAGGG